MNVITENKPLSATVEIFGIPYGLAPQTIAVREKIKAISKLSEAYENNLITAEDAVKTQLDFINSAVPTFTFFDDKDINSIDITDVEAVVTAIFAAYQRKVMAERFNGFAESFRDLFPMTKIEKAKKGKKKKKK